MRSRAKETLAARQERYKRAYDRHVQNRNAMLQVGDYVLVKVYAESPKLTLPMAGPYVVRRIDIRNGVFEINTAQGCGKCQVTMCDLRRYLLICQQEWR
jgi:hypothetical protein